MATLCNPLPRFAVRLLTSVAAALLLVAVQAQDAPSLVPTVASVQQAEPVPFQGASGTNLSRVRGVGVIGEPALSVAWFDARDGLLWVSFRLAGDRPVGVRRLNVSTADGSVHAVVVGSVTVHPAADPDAPLVSIAELVESAPPPTARIGAWLFQNRSDEPVSVATVAYAPPGAARDVVLVRTFGGSHPRGEFDLWVRSVEAVVAGASAASGNGSPTELEDELGRTFAADLQRVDESGMLDGIELAPGDAIGLVLTPASFAEHVGDAALFIDPAVTTISADGTRRVAFSAGPTVRPRVP